MKKNNVHRKVNKVRSKKVVPKKVSKERVNKIVFWCLIIAFVFWSISSVLGIIAFFRTNKPSAADDDIITASADIGEVYNGLVSESDWLFPSDYSYESALYDVGNVIDYGFFNYLEGVVGQLDCYYSITSSPYRLQYLWDSDVGFQNYVIELNLTNMVSQPIYELTVNFFFIGAVVPSSCQVFLYETTGSTVLHNGDTSVGDFFSFSQRVSKNGYIQIVYSDTYLVNQKLQIINPYIYLETSSLSGLQTLPNGFTSPLPLLVNWTKNTYYDLGYIDGQRIGYDEGYEEGQRIGYEAGYADGLADGERVGYDLGYDYGYDAGYDEGYSVGNREGQTIGYNVGYVDGFDEGYIEGYDLGYGAGVSAGSNPRYTFSGLISSVIDVPIRSFTSLFNFEILGVNLADFFFALLTVMAVLAVVKLLI